MKLVLASVLVIRASSWSPSPLPPDRDDADGRTAAAARRLVETPRAGEIADLVDRLEPREDTLVQRLRRVLPSLPGQVALHRNLDEQAPERRAAALEERLEILVEERFPAGGSGGRAGGGHRAATLAVVASVERERAQLAPRLARVAAGLAEYPPVDRDLAATLAEPGAAAVIAATGPTPDRTRRSAARRDPFLETSPLGSSLLERADGTWRVNRHRRREVATFVRRLRERLVDYATLSPRIEALFGRRVDAELRAALASDAGRAWLSVTLARDVDHTVRADTWRAWETRHVDAAGRVRAEVRPALAALLDRAVATRQEIESTSTLIAIEPATLSFRSEHVHLLRSSTFYNPRTPRGREIYESEFPDHHAARLFGVFDMPAMNSQNPIAFRRRLARRNAWVRDLARTHDTLLVYIGVMPEWLSVSRDRRVVADGPAYRMYPPRDYEAWKTLVRDLVRFMRQIPGVRVYYEIWNEPAGYWLDDMDAFLRLYEVTAEVIRSEDPQARVGGAAVNHWKDGLPASPDRGPINMELIRQACGRGLPLDFVSWHHFGRPPSELARAKAAYVEALRDCGRAELPEFVVSEWSFRHRGTVREAVMGAETMLALFRAEVDLQMVAAWEEFHPVPDPKAFPPWGMVTRQGVRKPMFFVHRFFDRLSRDSDGIAVIDADREIRIVLSRKNDGTLELVAWSFEHAPAFAAAVGAMRAGGVTGRRLRRYGNLDDLEVAIRHERPRAERDAAAVRRAAEVYRETARTERPGWVRLELAGARRIEVLEGQSVRNAVRSKRAYAHGNHLLFDLAANEVVWLRVRPAASGDEDAIGG